MSADDRGALVGHVVLEAACLLVGVAIFASRRAARDEEAGARRVVQDPARLPLGVAGAGLACLGGGAAWAAAGGYPGAPWEATFWAHALMWLSWLPLLASAQLARTRLRYGREGLRITGLLGTSTHRPSEVSWVRRGVHDLVPGAHAYWDVLDLRGTSLFRVGAAMEGGEAFLAWARAAGIHVGDPPA